ncbi:unnamed protein product [Paramecium sonneborni]|uniref:Uncharacterized protein n=1 Tax=Paramecium sonneborni TaxID=65129 RepID=A0A8S1RTH6_9CILI|nr:unnamed protein product [Paramecium sonneborni]
MKLIQIVRYRINTHVLNQLKQIVMSIYLLPFVLPLIFSLQDVLILINKNYIFNLILRDINGIVLIINAQRLFM